MCSEEDELYLLAVHQIMLERIFNAWFISIEKTEDVEVIE
tara:strand:+ start:443 stop:562 length:120 start_codon:yes stop_codon:yes gene_type:complete